MAYDSFDLIQLLDPTGKAATRDPVAWKALDEGQRIDQAFGQFHTDTDGLDPEKQKAKRNQIQERLLGASNQLCHQYQQYMQNVNSTGNFALGFLTTATAAAGALVTGGTSQILAGTAAAASGTRAEFNQDYFYDVTVATIFEGIESRRDASYDKIKKDRQSESIADYSIETAVKDAIAYHTECSLVAGVQELGDQVKLAKDPGLDQVGKAFLKFNIIQDIATRKSTNAADLLGHDTIGVDAAAALSMDTNSASSDLRDDPIAAHALLQNSVASATHDFVDKMARTEGWPDTDPAGAKKDYQKLMGDLAATRSSAAVKQLAACQSKVMAAASAIAGARFDLSKSATDADRASAQAVLDAKVLEGRARISEMSPAAAWLREDLTWLQDGVKDEAQKADAGHAKTMDAGALDKLLNDFPTRPTAMLTLTCAT